MRLLRHRHRETPAASPVDGHTELAPHELRQLSTVFAAPHWLENLGRAAWLLVGVFALLVGLAWFVGKTYTIGGPVVAATIVATVAMPLVGWLARHMPRAVAAVLVLLGLVAIAVVIVVMVVAGITGQHEPIAGHSSEAVTKAQGWLQDVGVDKQGADSAGSDLKADVPKIISTLTKGVINGIRGVASVVFGLSLAALSLFFLLKDGPSMRAWVDRHLGLPPPVARTITSGVIRSLRGYFRGVTIVAAFNGIVVSIGALLLGVPLAGTIGVVSFVTAYVPFIGAFVAGAFAVVIALGANGAGTAVAMLLIVLLANGLLQNLLQPIAMGSALDLHPLVVLVTTIAAGCLFGTLGLILAAPLLSAAVHITRELAAAKALAAAQSSAEPESSSASATS
jgi:predicted PurR-regulated permease PerM